MYWHKLCEDLTPQYGDTICQWGGNDGITAENFRNRKYKITVVDEKSIWVPVIQKDKIFTLSYSWVVDKAPVNSVLSALEEIKAHTVDIAWFTILPDKDRPKPYWAASFARVFPRFNFTDDHGRLYVKAFPELLR